jgi:zinc transport system substrate-binding protein
VVVASFYPLAWAAERVGGPGVEVVDLTPPGVEAHETTLTAGQRAELQTADVVLTLGSFGFQPDVERAAEEAEGSVVAVAESLDLRPSTEQDLDFDPHVWLDPGIMERIVAEVAEALADADPDGEVAYRDRGEALRRSLTDLDDEFASRLSACEHDRFVTTHEAFGYLADAYGLSQIGIEGITPESEPSAERIQAAIDEIRAGTAAPAVFYEGTDEGRRTGESVAADAGVDAIPLGTLEFDPAPEDYISVMRANLSALREGLQCRP